MQHLRLLLGASAVALAACASDPAPPNDSSPPIDAGADGNAVGARPAAPPFAFTPDSGACPPGWYYGEDRDCSRKCKTDADCLDGYCRVKGLALGGDYSCNGGFLRCVSTASSEDECGRSRLVE